MLAKICLNRSHGFSEGSSGCSKFRDIAWGDAEKRCWPGVDYLDGIAEHRMIGSRGVKNFKMQRCDRDCTILYIKGTHREVAGANITEGQRMLFLFSANCCNERSNSVSPLSFPGSPSDAPFSQESKHLRVFMKHTTYQVWRDLNIGGAVQPIVNAFRH